MESPSETQQNIEKVLERIKKCLAVSEDKNNNNAEEAAVAARMAAKLMEKYQIDQSDLILEELTSSDSIGEEIIDNISHISWPRWLQCLAITCSILYECKAMFVQDSNDKEKSIKIVGYKPDVKVTVWTFHYLREELERLANIEIQNLPDLDSHIKSVKCSFYNGAVTSIRLRVNKIVDDRNKNRTGNGKALIIAKDTAIAEKYGDINYRQSKTNNVDSLLYNRGLTAGNSVNINRPIEPSHCNIEG